MKFEEINGNLLDMFKEGKFHVIIHGANCQNLMGAGIAGQIAKRYPIAVAVDEAYKLPLGPERLGCFSIAKVPHLEIGEKYIVNLYSQIYPGNCADLDGIRLGLRKFSAMYHSRWSNIGVPLIGCGIGGLDWKDVREIIKSELALFNVTVVHYDVKNK